ncbi:MAG: hypothetical protein ABWY26_09235 [Microbacterium sp.]
MIPPLEIWHAHHIAREHAPTPWNGVLRSIAAFSLRILRVEGAR